MGNFQSYSECPKMISKVFTSIYWTQRKHLKSLNTCNDIFEHLLSVSENGTSFSIDFKGRKVAFLIKKMENSKSHKFFSRRRMKTLKV